MKKLIKTLDKALKESSHNYLLWATKGLTLTAFCKYDEAMGNYYKAIEADSIKMLKTLLFFLLFLID